MAADEQEVIALRQQIEKLNSGQEPEPIPPEKLEELRKKVADDAKKAQELAKQVAKIDADLQKLKGQLDQTQPVSAPPAKIVSLPNPREAPKDAKPLLVICRDGRVAAFDPDDLRESAQKRAQFLLTPLQKKAGPERRNRLPEVRRAVQQSVGGQQRRLSGAVGGRELQFGADLRTARHGGRDGETGAERQFRVAARAEAAGPAEVLRAIPGLERQLRRLRGGPQRVRRTERAGGLGAVQRRLPVEDRPGHRRGLRKANPKPAPAPPPAKTEPGPPVRRRLPRRCPTTWWTDSCSQPAIDNRHFEDRRSAQRLQPLHDRNHVLARHHHAHRAPAGVFQAADRG